MPKEKILISVKTYPSLSTKYGELVCTAGFRENGEWVRIFPVPFRRLGSEEKYKKYDWIEVDLEKGDDRRKESFKIKTGTDIKVVGHIKSDGGAWHERRKICLNKVYNSLDEIIRLCKDEKEILSLAVFKPSNIKRFYYKKSDLSNHGNKLRTIEMKSRQTLLFDEFASRSNELKIVDPLPFEFRIKFVDINGNESDMMIEDWEVGALFFRMLSHYRNQEIAASKVVDKYNDIISKKDIFLFLGTTKQFHWIAPNPFIIIGMFCPDYVSQMNLF